jgi:purine-binding chemotaxis protein CheW
MAQQAEVQRALVRADTAAESYSLLVVFQLAGQEYGVLADIVREIIRRRATTRVPHAAPGIDGVINLRGRIIPVFNLRRCLHLPEITATDELAGQAVMVVERDGDDAGFLVDRVTDVVKITESEVDHSTRRVKSGLKEQYIEGMVKLPGRLVTLLRLDPLLDG